MLFHGIWCAVMCLYVGDWIRRQAQSKQIQAVECMGVFADVKFFFRMYLSAPVDGNGRIAPSHIAPPTHLIFKRARTILEDFSKIISVVYSHFAKAEASFNSGCH